MMGFFLREMIESLLHEDNPPEKSRGIFIVYLKLIRDI
jgi:hypothetical protein